MNLNRITLGTLVLSSLILASCGKKQDETDKKAPEYETMVVQAQEATLESKYPAVIKGEEDIDIRPRIDGFIKEIYVDEGSSVKKGQALFKIDSPVAEQGLRTAQAAVESAKAQLNTAKINVDRIRPLAQKGIMSDVQLQTYQNAYESAMAVYTQANAQLTNAQATMSWTNVTSPSNGVVGSIPLRKGSLVNNSNVLTTIANTANVYVYFSLNEKDLISVLANMEGNTQAEKIKKFPPVSLMLADGSTYPEKGKISTITGSVDQSTGSVSFRADFPNNGVLRSGFSGNIIIPTHMSNVFVIPQESTFGKLDKYLTYTVVGDSVKQTIIQVVPMPDGKSYLVTEGLSAGDRIVSKGLATLTEGKKITVK